MAWISSHRGIPGNERVDSLAKQTASNGRKPKFRIPHTDFYFCSSMKAKCHASLANDFLIKGTLYFSHFFRIPPPFKPWFSRLSLPREQVITLCRFRLNHYNLNYNLNRKNIVASSACPCGDPRQDINHIIFRCLLTSNKSLKLRHFFLHCNPPIRQDFTPLSEISLLNFVGFWQLSLNLVIS